MSPAPATAPIVNAAEHAWTLRDPRFAFDPNVATCPNHFPDYEQTHQDLQASMVTYGVDRLVISHVCYYGGDNSYTLHCVQQDPERFAGIGLLVGYRLHSPNESEANADRLETLCARGLAGLRLSPIYDREIVWLNDPACDHLWQRAAELGAVFNIFLAPAQIPQLAEMAERHPGVNVVVDHFAMIDIDRPEEEGILPLLNLHRLPNVYLRTSLHNPSKQGPPFRDMWPYLQRAYDRFGPQRLIYGNFYELLIMKDLIPFFTAEDKEWILGRTAQHLYFAE
ncbi:MAG: amidohydrolase family protein [Candidatus Latescibacterota bacterium]|nr:amidohydrolase family protein [Candidatus Latescibacterota bacterium]